LRPIQTKFFMHAYRSHTCGALRSSDAGANVRLSGWVHRKRDLGGLLFVDLRDHYGITQLVLHPSTPGFAIVERLRAESVIKIDGEAVMRDPSTVNALLPTGEVCTRTSSCGRRSSPRSANEWSVKASLSTRPRS
jgi:aspartyl-tRNA synthetase